MHEEVRQECGVSIVLSGTTLKGRTCKYLPYYIYLLAYLRCPYHDDTSAIVVGRQTIESIDNFSSQCGPDRPCAMAFRSSSYPTSATQPTLATSVTGRDFDSELGPDFGDEGYDHGLDDGVEGAEAVHFILLAEFDIDAGATLAHQYPYPTGTDEQYISTSFPFMARCTSLGRSVKEADLLQSIGRADAA